MICPDCSNDLYDTATSCSCGWKKPWMAAIPKPTYPSDRQPIPEHIQAKLDHFKRTFGRTSSDPKAWVRKILAREANGERVVLYALVSARQALGYSAYREPGEEG